MNRHSDSLQSAGFASELGQTRNTREPVKPGIKRQDPVNLVMFHDGEVHRISRRKMPIPHHNLFRALCIGLTNRKYLIDDSEQSVERGLDCIAAIDGDVPVQDLLKYLGIGNQALALADQLFQHLLRVAFVRMSWPDEVHRDI